MNQRPNNLRENLQGPIRGLLKMWTTASCCKHGQTSKNLKGGEGIPSVKRSIPRQDKTRQDKTRQDKTRQDKTRQDKTRQDKTRQDKTRQDKTRA